MLAPIKGSLRIRQLFGSMKGGAAEAYTATHNGQQYQCRGHAGIDIDAAIDTPVYAVKDGKVHFYGPAWGFPEDGYSTWLGLHAVLTLSTGEQFWYAHLSTTSIVPISAVNEGAQIGLSGATGNVSGAHLHFAWRPANPNYASGFDGFGCWLTHLDPDALARLDLSLV